MAYFITIPIGLILWYFLFSSELMLNGATADLKSIFTELWREFTWILPGGYNRKKVYVTSKMFTLSEDDQHIVELIKSLPGIIHFIAMHIVIPLLPQLIWWLITGKF
jgi:hypothetical protein